MVGPSSATMSPAPSSCICATVFSTTPAYRPRHPAWAAPMTPVSLHKSSGAQSAVRIASAAADQVGDGRVGVRPAVLARFAHDHDLVAVNLVQPVRG